MSRERCQRTGAAGCVAAAFIFPYRVRARSLSLAQTSESAARSGPTYRRTSAAMRTATMMLTTIQTSRTTCACDLIFALSCDQSNKFMTLDHFYYLNFLGLLFFPLRRPTSSSLPRGRSAPSHTPAGAPLTSAKSRLLSASFGE